MKDKICDAVRSIWYFLLVFFFPDKYIAIRASVDQKNGSLLHSNWGDDLNGVITSFITKKKVLMLPWNGLSQKLPIPHFMIIGSILTFYPLKNAVVWGSGIINDRKTDAIQDVPKKILAVRGPKTREELQKKGIDCPEIYGDPALLMPKFYQPSKEKKYEMGLIPHISDLKDENVMRLLRDKRVKLIKVSGYTRWQDFIDEINECKVVCSSSLHGLIISEAYDVPALWCEFGYYSEGWEFKFNDFYASIGKYDEVPMIVDHDVSVDDLIERALEWEKGKINIAPLLECCPF